MKELDILKLVEETFDEEISTKCANTMYGLESWIEGRDEFSKKLTYKLMVLFDSLNYTNDEKS